MPNRWDAPSGPARPHCAGSHELTMHTSSLQDRTVGTISQPDVSRSFASQTIYAQVYTIPGVDCNCLLHALRYTPGKELDRD